MFALLVVSERDTEGCVDRVQCAVCTKEVDGPLGALI